MSEQKKVHKVSPSAFIFETERCAYSLSTNIFSGHDEAVFSMGRNPNWEYAPQPIGGKRIVPYGPANDLPVLVRDLMQNNHLAPGILERKKGLLYGQGPRLYRDVVRDGQIVREWVDDPAITAWLRSWRADRFIERAIVDVLHTNGFFCLHQLERGHRLGKAPRIAALKHVSATNARLEWADSRDIDDVAHIFTGDFENNCIPGGIRSYPVHDPLNPGKHGVSASYNYIYTFGRNFYSTPAFMGAIRWVLRGSDIPEIFKYVTENGLNLAYHVHSPDGYWAEKRERLEDLYPEEQPAEIQKRLDALKETVMDQITKVLSGKHNAGKLFESIDFHDDNGNLCSWKIESVDQKIKDFVESQLKISEAADSAIASGMQLHPSLTNIVIPGTLGSGSQMLYALKVHEHADTAIPEMVVLDPINQAIRFNFDTDLRLGFYRQAVKPEESLAPEDRLKNS